MRNDFLKSLEGSWEGSCKTWFQPGILEDESKIEGEFTLMFGGKFVRHEYQATIKGNPRSGMEIMAYNAITRKFQISWIDDFHMSDAIMFSQGEAAEKGFQVTGSYETGPGDPPWHWRTVFELADEQILRITAYNITPDGQEAKAVETVYRRTGS